VLLDFKKPFDLIPYYERSYEKEIFAKTQSKNFNLFPKNSQSLIWSQLLNAARTYFEAIANKV